MSVMWDCAALHLMPQTQQGQIIQVYGLSRLSPLFRTVFEVLFFCFRNALIDSRYMSFEPP